MSPREVIIFLAFIIVAVSGYCNRHEELERIKDEIAECESNISPYYALLMFNQMSTNTLTFERFLEKLHPFCEKPSHTLTCLGENVNVREDCQENDEIQSTLNMHSTAWYAAEFFCENNATRYLDLAVGDGPLCYANNILHYECMFQSKYRRIVYDRAPLSNRNVCAFLRLTIDCLFAYDDCENKNVRLHLEKMNEQLQNQFGCDVYNFS